MFRWIPVLFAFSSVAHAADWSLAFRKDQAELPGGAALVEREAKSGNESVRIQGVFFDAESYAFRVVDNPTKDQGSLGDAMASGDFVAGVNGGYFHSDWDPVGLEIADGETINGFERAKILSGVFVVTGGRPRIVRSSASNRPRRIPKLSSAGRPSSRMARRRSA